MLSRKKDTDKPAERGEQPVAGNEAKAAAVRAKLDAVVIELAGLESEMAELALAASEGTVGAAAKLGAHRIRLDAAKRAVTELEAALRLAERLDRQQEATAVIEMRDAQLAEFTACMQARGEAMAEVMKALATVARAYGKFAEATLAAQIAVPIGATVPPVGIGKNGGLGPSFGACEALLLAELWRLGPARKDGAGRFVVPFAKSGPFLSSNDHRELSDGIDAFRQADQVVLDLIRSDVDRMNRAALSAAEERTAA